MTKKHGAESAAQGEKYNSGLSLIEVIIAIAIIILLFGGIYGAYFSILDVINNSGIRADASRILDSQLEAVRNLPYEQVGTVGGIPAGILPQSQNVTSTSGMGFMVQTVVRNVDDPFDGLAPTDTAPADYKLVEFTITCTTCKRFVPLTLTTTVAPKNLESASEYGSLFISVTDANGNTVPSPLVRVVNASVTPSIDFTDTGNASGVLQLVGVPTSTGGYKVYVSKTGYSSEETYAVGDPENPNPLIQYLNPNVTAQTVTSKSFSIDKVSALKVSTLDGRCAPVAGQDFSLQGSKMIGAGVYKFSTSSRTGADGTDTFNSMEWDTYTIAYGGNEDIAGTIPFNPFFISPSSSANFSYILATSSPDAMLVRTVDGSGNGISDASITLTETGFSASKETGHDSFAQTDWSSGQYSSQDGGLNMSVPGSVTLMANASGTYSTTTSWFISQTLDTGGAGSQFYSLEWNPQSEPPGTAVEFQVASNNDQSTWNFTGPDGTGGSYYTVNGSAINAGVSGPRYFRYKAYLGTSDTSVTPQLQGVTLDWRGICTPPYQSLFGGLGGGNYNLSVSAAGYQPAATSVYVGASWQEVPVVLTP